MTSRSEFSLDSLTPLEMALVVAAEALGGGGRESYVQQIAARLNPPPSTVHNHFSRAADTAVRKGALYVEKYGVEHQLWLTPEAWRALGHEDEPAPDPPPRLF